MNAGIITRIEYRTDGETPYNNLGFTGFSAEYATSTEKSRAGYRYHLQITMKIPRIGITTSALLHSLTGRKLNVKFTDGNGQVHSAGSAHYPARLTWEEGISGTAGSWNGYLVTITCDSPFPTTVTES